MATRFRDLCCAPAQFGEVPEAQFWVSDASGRVAEDLLLGAVFQHRIAVLMRARLKETRTSQASYAEGVGMSQDRLTRILRGYLPMSSVDIATAIATLDADRRWSIDPAHWLGVATAAERGSPAARQSTGIQWPDDLVRRASTGPISPSPLPHAR